MCDNDDDVYLNDHTERIKEAVKILKHYTTTQGKEIGNIGVSSIDNLLRGLLQCKKLVSIVPSAFPNIASDEFLQYDITVINSHPPERSFDILIFTEVLEHLLAEDEIVLKNVSSLVKQEGLLIASVPNAVSHINRVKVLFGHNIFWTKRDIISGVFGGFGHIREYNVREVRSLFSSHFRILGMHKQNPYGSRMIRRFLNLLPRTWSSTLLLVAVKKDDIPVK